MIAGGAIAGHLGPVELHEPYRTRAVRFLDLWALGVWRLKIYGIAYRRPRPRAPLIAAARSVIGDAVQALEGDHYGVGWATLHDARDGAYVLLDWWGGECMIFQRLWLGRDEPPHALTAAGAEAPIACTWELAVAAFERQAWIDNILANPGGPDIEGYLNARLNDDV